MPIQEHISENSNFEVLKKYWEQVIGPNFKINFGNSGFVQSTNSDNFSGYIKFPSSFISYKNTDYYYKGENQKFIHLTSLSTFFQIINEGYFLASQFSNHDDPLELIYAGTEMASVFTKKELQRLKELVFSFSMCLYEKDKDSFEMWRMYGNNGYGIGIVFSFYQNIDSWYDAFLSHVYYGNDDNTLHKFNKFTENHKYFMSSNPNFEMHSSVNGNIGISDSIALFLAFHKNSLFKNENEVRFLKSFVTGSENFSERNDSIGLVLNKKNDLHYAYKIPIVSKKNIDTISLKEKIKPIDNFLTSVITNDNILDPYIGNTPFIKIEKVILGYRYSEDDLNKLKNYESNVNQKIMSSPIHFELSQLSKEFNGA